MGDNLWNAREKYIKNSPVFNIDQVTTPVLLMNNKLDAIVPFNQGVEFFTGLRRLGKKVWMLQYDGEVHELINSKAKLDYMMRLDQFFDYYLKEGPLPEWMKEESVVSEK
jgi:dipeptidyl aminopeptidase/acylaminoacyl peptidase